MLLRWRADRIGGRAVSASLGRVSQVSQPEDFGALFLRQAAPDSVRFTGSQRLLAAFLEDRAILADCFGAVDSPLFLSSPFARGMEEYFYIHAPAFRGQLPIPFVREWEQGGRFH